MVSPARAARARVPMVHPASRAYLIGLQFTPALIAPVSSDFRHIFTVQIRAGGIPTHMYSTTMSDRVNTFSANFSK